MRCIRSTTRNKAQLVLVFQPEESTSNKFVCKTFKLFEHSSSCAALIRVFVAIIHFSQTDGCLKVRVDKQFP